MTDVHRTCRVGGNVFDVDLRSGRTFLGSEADTLIQYAGQNLVPDPLGDTQVDETRAGDRRLGNFRVSVELGNKLLGKIARLHAEWFCKHHCSIGGKIAMCRITRRFHDDSRKIRRLSICIF